MSLVPLTLHALKTSLSTPEALGCTSRRILSLGYPDILASPAQTARIFGPDIAAKLAFRADSQQILKWHNMGEQAGGVIEARSLFTALGYELDVIDLVEARGGEIIHDLNTPLPAEHHGRYAAVLDAGTLEHCFDIAQAAKNVAGAVALGGFAMHGNPLNMYNHGFYNLNPTWYHDFYAANGFAIERLDIVLEAVSETPRIGAAPAYQRFTNMPDGATLLAIARRKSAAEIRWPIQHKYVVNPTLQG
ncbi:hypothetical protein BWI17_08185 [Betaproteobacteria bacterium GR16-43]|nr:hypothetical protein BWI17_08185 [Betaproteobacteria bacterium GR16-43]